MCDLIVFVILCGMDTITTSGIRIEYIFNYLKVLFYNFNKKV